MSVACGLFESHFQRCLEASTLVGQVEAELNARGFPPAKVEVLDWTGDALALRHCVRRWRRGPQPPLDIGLALRLSSIAPSPSSQFGCCRGSSIENSELSTPWWLKCKQFFGQVPALQSLSVPVCYKGSERASLMHRVLRQARRGAEGARAAPEQRRLRPSTALRRRQTLWRCARLTILQMSLPS